MNTMSISRRRFAQLLGAGAAAVVVKPPLSFAKPTQSAATSFTAGRNIVPFNAKENPYGPSLQAFQGMTGLFCLSCPFSGEPNKLLVLKMSKIKRVKHQ